MTSQLREQEAGILEVGVTYNSKFAIPPGQRDWELTGYCLPQCTQQVSVRARVRVRVSVRDRVRVIVSVRVRVSV